MKNMKEIGGIFMFFRKGEAKYEKSGIGIFCVQFLYRLYAML